MVVDEISELCNNKRQRQAASKSDDEPSLRVDASRVASKHDVRTCFPSKVHSEQAKRREWIQNTENITTWKLDYNLFRKCRSMYVSVLEIVNEEVQLCCFVVSQPQPQSNS